MWLEVLVVLGLGLTPPVLSLWYARKAQREFHDRSTSARETVRSRRVVPPVEPVRLEILGDRSCRYNARSPYIRCAVNPEGPCQGCRHYEKQ
ncbi:hypothetical protein CKA32_004704 [Geitlerinema sp. FC II]|nr:DUF6464 family protein [Geitlerinema sp. CS-897]PPT05053.1 hypothetical protein CKA32_004704 [Geitlerinema sp. FC II]